MGYAVLVLALCLLFYFYREAYQYVREAVRFFSSKTRVSAYVSSFGPYAPFSFMGVQILQVLLAPIPGELTGFIGGYLFGTEMGLCTQRSALPWGPRWPFVSPAVSGCLSSGGWWEKISWRNSIT